MIDEVYRVLKPNGILYVNDSKLYMDRYEQFQEKYNTYGVFENPDGGVFRHHSKEHLDELLDSFEKKKVKY